jgi:hypothetical protein
MLARAILSIWAPTCAIAIALSAAPALAQSNPWAPEQTTVPIEIEVEPIAEIQFPDGVDGLHLYVPPANSTIPSNGLRFLVRGNALASVSAAPDQFMLVQHYITGPTNVDLGPKYLGRAQHTNGETIGYSLQVEFPVGSTRTLPLTNGNGTIPLTVDMVAAGGQETGFLHLIASHRWTPTGGMPSVGDYFGNIVVTVSASNL